MIRQLPIALLLAVLTAACASDAASVASSEPEGTSPSTNESATSTGPASPSTATPAPTTDTAAGVGNGFSLSFDGIDDRVLVPWDASFPTEVFTAGAWVRLPEPPARRSAIIARGEDDDSYDLSWQLFVANDGNLQIMMEASNMDNYCYPGNDCVPQGECTTSGDLFIADGDWHHVAVARDAAGTLIFYVDGEEQARCEDTGVPSSDNHQFLSIGATFGTIGPPPGGVEPPIWFLSGQIDDAVMWNTSLSGAQIAAVVADGVDLSAPELVGYWTFDEGTGQDVIDGSPAQNDGFLGAEPAADSADPVWTR